MLKRYASALLGTTSRMRLAMSVYRGSLPPARVDVRAIMFLARFVATLVRSHRLRFEPVSAGSSDKERPELGTTQMGRGRAHVLAVLAAVATLAMLRWLLPEGSIAPQAIVSGHVSNLGANYPTQLGTLQRLGRALEHGEAVVLLSSSELTSSDLRFIPYNFLGKELAAPVTAYGHAYFQSLGMYFLLASLEEKLSAQSRVVIMVSPGWFDSRGLDRAAFKEHVLPLLPHLVQRADTRDALLH
ncbi:D-alanyl-lipoteichoic acid biosynthesis protein DltD [Bordetella holmesii]|uniref:DltD central region domain protein n=1 Tax=Bordetella holmesii CDC-H585-BH TaxID=1331206 RepID=A0A158MAW9_9BORD|nr:D-alanyl-lipoteichoic acid biosynthesis protein DltD [Bordetella holmesii]AHV93853.1 dltD central region family protein [Bordetella holmesii ATCC 51541]AIT27395.1 dltD central region family protein [Bordetella holmesii 44057]EWM42946.1 dltD central region family protein [Bordetella holmesii 41130]EWM47985.1 dltD central region family protein [Bordetella holmesii 35009]EWM48962.1 dltD central region family protein [Bordetella holmesii 70147]